MEDIIQFFTVYTRSVLKDMNRKYPNSLLRDIMDNKEPELLQDTVQEFILSLLKSGINLDQPIKDIKADGYKTIVCITRTNKEMSALQRAANDIHNFIRKVQRKSHTISKPKQGKSLEYPLFSFDAYTPGTEAHEGLYYISDDRTENGIREDHLKAIEEIAIDKMQYSKLVKIYDGLRHGYTRKEIAIAIGISYDSVKHYVNKIRKAISAI